MPEELRDEKAEKVEQRTAGTPGYCMRIQIRTSSSDMINRDVTVF